MAQENEQSTISGMVSDLVSAVTPGSDNVIRMGVGTATSVRVK